MTATMIQASVNQQSSTFLHPVTVRQPANAWVVVGAFLAVALVIALLIAMAPGLARVPSVADEPRALEAPVPATTIWAPSDGAPSLLVAAPQPGPHPGR